METSDELAPAGKEQTDKDINIEQAPVDKLHKNAFGLPSVFFLCIAAIAPAASMLFNVPVTASQAGAATPLVFLLSAIAILLFGNSITYFAGHLSSAGGFSTWVRHSLGKMMGFHVGWMMLGAYALFETALQATVGGSLDLNLSSFGLHLPGGWLTYALLFTLLIGVLAYFDVKISLWVMAPFAMLEVLGLLILDTAITLKGGTSGHDLLHTLTPAGADLRGIAPGGILGIGIAMAPGILAFIGSETAAVYGEETRHPKRTLPVAIFSLLIALGILYVWTSYAATIGVGWQHAGDILGNVSNAPQQYLLLAEKYVGGWLGVGLLGLVITSNIASAFAMHHAMTRYFYSMGREEILPRLFGKTHPKWHSPHLASTAQSLFTALILCFLGLIIKQDNADGSVRYALGFADGKIWQQASGIVSFQWLANIVTMCIVLVYIVTNIALPFFAHSKKEFNVWRHAVMPGLSTVLLLLPLASFLLPPLPGIGAFFTNLGFAPTPFPLNILPFFVLIWFIIGAAYATYLEHVAPERFDKLGRILRLD